MSVRLEEYCLQAALVVGALVVDKVLMGAKALLVDKVFQDVAALLIHRIQKNWSQIRRNVDVVLDGVLV